MNYNLKKFVLASMLASLSIVLNLIPAYILPQSNQIQLPFYQLPLIIAGIYLGKYYILFIALIADLGIGFLNPHGYLPLFIFSKLAWGLIPAIFLYKRNFNIITLSITIIISYLLATTLNGLSVYIYFGRNIFKLTFIYRFAQFIALSPIMIILTKLVIKGVGNKNYNDIIDFILFKNKYKLLGNLLYE